MISITYVILGKLSLLLAIPPGYASAIFPSAGVAVTVSFIACSGAVPGIFLGSFFLNLWIAYGHTAQLTLPGYSAALLIALASSLQAILGGRILRRSVGYPVTFDNLRDVLRFHFLSPFICLISATLSVSALQLLGLIPSSGFWTSWLIWWAGDTLGLLVFLPLTMVVVGAPRALWRKRLGTVALPMILALSLLVILYFTVSHWEEKESLVELRLQSQRLADTMQARLDEQESLLDQTRGLFAGDDRVSQEEFHQFTLLALKRFPMIQSIEWAPQVTTTARYLKGTRHPSVPKSVHYPITYIEPLEGNEAAKGFDIMSTPDRAEAINTANRSGRSVATAPLHLVQSPHNFGFLLLEAVDTSHAGPGVVLVVIRTDAFLDKLLTQSDRAQLRLRLTDSATRQVVYNNFPTGQMRVAWQHRLLIGQRELLLETMPSTSYVEQHREWQSTLVLVAGLLGTGLLGAFLMLGTGYTARVEAQVDEKVAELSESSEKLSGLYQLSPLGIVLTDMQGRFIDFNDAFLHICGYSAEELKTLNYKILMPACYQADLEMQYTTLRQSGRYGPTEQEYQRKDGCLVPISLNSLLLRSRNGEKYIWTIVEDITQRRQAQATLRDSEERWKFALEGAGDGVWDWNLQTGEMYLSRQEMAVLGFDGKDAQWMHASEWEALQHPRDRTPRKLALELHLSGKTPVYSYEFRIRTPEGRWKWLLARGLLVSRSDDGRPLRIIGTHSDIDSLKRQRAENARRNAVMEMLARGGKLHEVLGNIISSLEAENNELTFLVFSFEAGVLAEHKQLFPLDWLHASEPTDLRGGSGLEGSMTVWQSIADVGYRIRVQELLGSMGLELCWSEPILAGESTLEGVLVSCRQQVEQQALPDLLHQQQAANLLSIAIQHERSTRQQQLANLVYLHSSEGIVVANRKNLIEAVNPAFEIITGYSAIEVIGQETSMLRSERHSTDFMHSLWQTILTMGAWQGEYWIRRKDGTAIPLSLSINTISDEDGRVLRRLAVFTDISAKMEAEAQIHHLAHHDLLTNLPNRALFTERLSQVVAQAHRNQSHFTLLFIDLDHFKPVNDTYGHAVGDLLLQAAANRMRACTRESDTIARLGGDEFIVILPGAGSIEDASRIAEKIVHALKQPFSIKQQDIQISCSIGGAIYPVHGMNEDQLMQHADQAMYRAKTAGRNQVIFFVA
ncbi:diguanylate cyclase domain-containing protein [Aquitalea aquatica]|uniref:Diguanylate cyclase n=1 Tax=Aquitalea aquatica TaxID=3044273 RepID=A0A838Y327_9NEIS|nr:diguanylate cyclase [Aquitalea magnusonii]MBA4709076.1 diguanylate cyclase [Aquitalea magnusonii]